MRLADHAFSTANPSYSTSPTWATRSPGTRAWAAPSAAATALVTGREPREWLYVATHPRAGTTTPPSRSLTTGSRTPMAPRWPSSRQEADPGPVPSPTRNWHAGCGWSGSGLGLPTEPAEEPDDEMRDPVAVLADCLDRDDAELSASDYRRACPGQRRPPRRAARAVGRPGERGRPGALPASSVQDALPEEYRRDDLGPEATWLWRTMRAAEAGRAGRARGHPGSGRLPTLADARSMWPACWTRGCGRSSSRWSRCRRDRGPTGCASSTDPR